MPTSRPTSPASTVDWSVSIPLSALADLQSLPERMKVLESANAQLRAEVSALRDQYTELLIQFSDLKKRS